VQTCSPGIEDARFARDSSSERGTLEGNQARNGPRAPGHLPVSSRDVEQAGPETPQTDEWVRRRGVADRYFAPWLERTHPLAGSTVLEYGCGYGPVSVALAPRVGRYIGYDIEEGAVAIARERVKEAGVDSNVELHAIGEDRILDAVAEHEGELDIVLLYAVLEHMTVRERLDLLELAFRLVRRSGLVAVIESPNRLAPVDWHTSFLPFLCQLPEPLAVAYAERSTREDFREAMADAASVSDDAARKALTRWGRGISYHEFELVLGDVGGHVIAGGYDPQLWDERPLQTEEKLVYWQLQRARPDLPPVFWRYWLDLALSPEPVPRPTPDLIWPWILETRGSPGAHWTRWEAVELEAGALLAIELPTPSRRIVATVSLGEPAGEVTVHAGGETLRRPVAAKPGYQVQVDLELRNAETQIGLSMSHPGFVHFVGYAAPGSA
jgi:SAM-dependent methyltransferase